MGDAMQPCLYHLIAAGVPDKRSLINLFLQVNPDQVEPAVQWNQVTKLPERIVHIAFDTRQEYVVTKR